MTLNNPVTAYIGLGSNLGQSLGNVEQALTSLNMHPTIDVVGHSNWYGSKAIGPGTQPDYVNGAAALQTTLSARELLRVLLQTEAAYGRVREERWAARTLDLDLLWYDDQTISESDLEVPHPRLSERNFVLLPLNDLAPELVLNGGSSVQTTLDIVGLDGIWKLSAT